MSTFKAAKTLKSQLTSLAIIMATISLVVLLYMVITHTPLGGSAPSLPKQALPMHTDDAADINADKDVTP